MTRVGDGAPKGADRFETENMHDGSPVLHRDKKVSRWMALALIIPGLFTFGIAVFIAMVNATADKPLPPAALPIVLTMLALLATLFIVLGLVFAVLRTIVTEDAVHVKYGLWGPTISLRSIRSCKLVPYRWTDYGGWGIRGGRDGSMAYIVSGAQAVEIVFEEDGTLRKVLVGGSNIEALAIEIRRAVHALERPRIAAAGTASTAEGTLAEAGELESEDELVDSSTDGAKRARR